MPFQRLFDLLVAVPLALVVLPVCLLLLVAIRLETPGSPLFVQRRVGKGQAPFDMLKLRTMHTGTANVASHQVGAASITRLGALLRRLKLDELPQLWNVLAGHMSLVGPRPCLPGQAELVAERASRGLFALRPGVTGPAQIAGIDMSDPVRLATYEAEYFTVDRPLGDVRLIVSTALGGGRGDAATVAKPHDSSSHDGDKA
ncbi:sugar transferase [Qipengyuania sp. DSG2-2]|uniref:sugar transferase n=1 Tax=Qipengyuania sp. DGS2-2 TaxID=3349631 RepID=UPI0036D33DCF